MYKDFSTVDILNSTGGLDRCMDATQLTALASVVMSGVSLLSVIYFAGVKLATLQVKVDTMWAFTLRRAQSEAVITGMATVNSPIMITEDAKKLVDPILGSLVTLYRSCSPSISDQDFAIEIARNLGDRLLHEVCIPNKLSLGACLFIAIETVKQAVARRH